MLFKIQVFDLMAQSVLELTLPDDEKSGIWNFAHDYVRRINEISLALAWIESGDISDEGAPCGSQNVRARYARCRRAATP